MSDQEHNERLVESQMKVEPAFPLREMKIKEIKMYDRELFDAAGFVVKDSGERAHFDSGMQRDVTTGKLRYDLVFDGPMFARIAAHLTKGAVKYEPRNWMKARGQEEMDRFKQSAVRHFMQWIAGDTDEDHAAAVYFNINGYEYVKERMNEALPDRKPS